MYKKDSFDLIDSYREAVKEFSKKCVKCKGLCCEFYNICPRVKKENKGLKNENI